MRRLPRINSALNTQLPAIQQGFYYYPLPAPGNGTYATIPINNEGALIQMTNAPTANTWYLDFTGVSLSVNYAITLNVIIPQSGASAFTPTILVNGFTATTIGSGLTSATNSTNRYFITIICTAPNQYSYFGYVISV